MLNIKDTMKRRTTNDGDTFSCHYSTLEVWIVHSQFFENFMIACSITNSNLGGKTSITISRIYLNDMVLFVYSRFQLLLDLQEEEL